MRFTFGILAVVAMAACSAVNDGGAGSGPERVGDFEPNPGDGNGSDGGNGGGNGIDRGQCDAFIACTTDVAPETTANNLLAYGPDAACWNTETTAKVCRDACAAALAEMHKAFPSSEACGAKAIVTHGKWKYTDAQINQHPSCSVLVNARAKLANKGWLVETESIENGTFPGGTFSLVFNGSKRLFKCDLKTDATFTCALDDAGRKDTWGETGLPTRDFALNGEFTSPTKGWVREFVDGYVGWDWCFYDSTYQIELK